MGALSGKSVIVTGSGRGIGAACARSIARLGAAVVVNDIDARNAEAVAEGIRADGGRAVAHIADISSWQGAGGLIERCVREFGAVDGLVNNAALFMMGRLDEMQEGECLRLLNVNVIGTANCAAHAVRHMQKRRSGSIVNVTSGAHMGMLAMGIYGATKGAVASFTYTWAMELKDHGIRVNALSPRADTPMGDIRKDYMRARGVEGPPALQLSAEGNTPVVEFLLSDDAADITGQIVRIDGAQLTLCSHPMVALPLQRNERWTFESVRDAFREGLVKRQFPSGIVGIRNFEVVLNRSHF
jgi:NAD(P)-dependent dehydrogenase (short-subunit alcohol dehydrogenase family)